MIVIWIISCYAFIISVVFLSSFKNTRQPLRLIYTLSRIDCHLIFSTAVCMIALKSYRFCDVGYQTHHISAKYFPAMLSNVWARLQVIFARISTAASVPACLPYAVKFRASAICVKALITATYLATSTTDSKTCNMKSLENLTPTTAAVCRVINTAKARIRG